MLYYHHSMKRFFILFLLIFTTLLGVGNFSYIYADPADGVSEIQQLNSKIEEHKKKIKELEAAMETYKKNINEKQLEAVSLKNQMAILDGRIQQIETDVDLTQEKISSAELEIRALEISIGDKSTVIEQQKKMIESMVKKIEADDQKNYIEILLTNSSFADFYSQVKSLEDVYKDIGRSVKNLRLARQELSTKKDQISERKKTYEDLKSQLVNKKQDLGEQKQAKKTLLADTKASETQYQTLLTNLKKQYQSIEDDIRSYEAEIRKKLAAQSGKPIPTGDVVLDWPVPSRYITAYFRDPKYPFRNVFEHSAIDLRAAYGTPIRAAASGYVGRARTCTSASCYAYVLLVHTSSVSTVYGHMSKILVEQDQYVNKGDIIGYSGGTPGTVGAGPFVTGAHLHFEVRLNGIPVNPLGYLAQ